MDWSLLLDPYSVFWIDLALVVAGFLALGTTVVSPERSEMRRNGFIGIALCLLYLAARILYPYAQGMLG